MLFFKWFFLYLQDLNSHNYHRRHVTINVLLLLLLSVVQDIQKLKNLYYCVDDIDFLVGALLEMPAEGSKFGPTTQCILADNFYRQKIGDRFFYDIIGQPGSFTTGRHCYSVGKKKLTD